MKKRLLALLLAALLCAACARAETQLPAFAYQGDDMEEGFDFCGGRAVYDEVADFEEENFNFYIHRRKDDFYVDLTYNTKEYSEAFISRFLDRYVRAMHGLAEGKKPSEIAKEFEEESV